MNHVNFFREIPLEDSESESESPHHRRPLLPAHCADTHSPTCCNTVRHFLTREGSEIDCISSTQCGQQQCDRIPLNTSTVSSSRTVSSVIIQLGNYSVQRLYHSPRNCRFHRRTVLCLSSGRDASMEPSWYPRLCPQSCTQANQPSWYPRLCPQ